MFRLSFFLAFLLIMTASADEQAVSNKMCPVLPNRPIVQKWSVEYNGKQVYFCCKSCVRKFNENPQNFLANLPQFGGKEKREASVLRLLGKFHPVTVHFPIALLLAAALAELLLLKNGRESLAHAARFCTAIAALGAIFAASLGWFLALSDDYFGSTFLIHKYLGTALGICLIATAVASEAFHRTQNPTYGTIYRILLALSALLVIATGHYGGDLAHGPNYYSLH